MMRVGSKDDTISLSGYRELGGVLRDKTRYNHDHASSRSEKRDRDMGTRWPFWFRT